MYFTSPPLDINAVLFYVASVVNSRSNYLYYYPDAMPTNSTEWDNWVLWTDTDPRPSWQDLLDIYPAYCEYYYSQPAIRSDLMEYKALVDASIADLQSQIDVLTSAKADAIHGHVIADTAGLQDALDSKEDI